MSVEGHLVKPASSLLKKSTVTSSFPNNDLGERGREDKKKASQQKQ